jgi:ion channel-forming bestrophin family protein
MIQYNTKDWFGLIFRFHKSDTFRVLFLVLVSVGFYSALIVYAEFKLWGMDVIGSPVVHSLLGFVISLLLVFRTNTAYDRWWEARKHWGSLVNVSRNFSMRLRALMGGKSDNADFRDLRLFVGSYATVLKSHLRRVPAGELRSMVPDRLNIGSGDHVPNLMSVRAAEAIHRLAREHQWTDADKLAMLNDLGEFTDICGACERILNTPIPYTYNIFIKKFIFLFILTMPFAFAGLFGYWTVIVTVLTFYTLASLELIAESIEDPFGTDADDLPTDRLAAMILMNTEEIFNA